MAAILFTCLAGWNKMADKHDLLSAVFKVTAKTYGRDRICRWIQFCIVMWYRILWCGLQLVVTHPFYPHRPSFKTAIAKFCTICFAYLCRIVQYSSKFVAWAMVQRGLSEDLVDKIKALERSVSTARKCEFRTRLRCLASKRPLVLYFIVIFNCRPHVAILSTFSVNVWRGAVYTHFTILWSNPLIRACITYVGHKQGESIELIEKFKVQHKVCILVIFYLFIH